MTRNFSVFAIALLLVIPTLGCKEPARVEASKNATATDEEAEWITSNDSLTIKNGEVTVGTPKVTEDVEREIYKSLNHRRKMIAAIRKNSGPDRGVQQMQDELNLLTRGFISRYGLAQSDIDDILRKGDSNGWE